MSTNSRLPAVFAYLVPVIGWLYVLFFQRKNLLAVYHLKQSIGLCLFLILVLLAWGVVGWVLAWIPLLAVLSVALFTLVIAAYFCGLIAWVIGIIRALRNQLTPLPLFGRWADRLPIR